MKETKKEKIIREKNREETSDGIAGLSEWISGRILYLCNEYSLTYRDFAQKAGLSKDTVHNLIYRNSYPTVSTIAKICNGFGISISDFFSDAPFSEIQSLTNEEYCIVLEYRQTDAPKKDRLLTYWAGLNKKMPEDILNRNDI